MAVKRFDSDYLEGCHPKILERLTATNLEQTPGYGTDPHCERAAELIRSACDAPGAEVHFLVGGTQTNTTVIKSLLSPCEGVLCAETGHINVHEAGAIEATGHKVLALPTEDGALSAGQVRRALQDFYAACQQGLKQSLHVPTWGEVGQHIVNIYRQILTAPKA